VGLPGLLMARGPGVMAGYMDDPTATAVAIDKDGFFDTGDLGRMNPATGDIIVTGRAKDTIVLSNGENVAPQPIEDAVVASSALVDQAMLVGQDQSYLSALVVVNVGELANRGLISSEKASELEKAIATANSNGNGAEEARRTLRSEADALNDASGATIREAVLADLEPVSARLKSWERIGQVRIILEPFSLANGQLTQTLKIKRPSVFTSYKSLIDSIYQSRRSK
jgi:long-chain acyl-CoA synthetase